ncbi:MAG: ATP-binding protein [Campylobacterota bacterium]|nr:ATP-binding protein [Campylobacterota bacterium]
MLCSSSTKRRSKAQISYPKLISRVSSLSSTGFDEKSPHKRRNSYQSIHNSQYHSIRYPNELSQVLVNLLQNAKDAFSSASRSRRQIDICIYTQNDDAVIEVEDNAGGIDKDILEKIFEPYFTTKHATRGQDSGSSCPK